MSVQPAQKIAVFMIDGFDMAYFNKTDMPVMHRMAQEGFFKKGSAIFPSLTNANNISIACGAWPDAHGVTTNCYFDPSQGKACFLEHPSFLKAKTIFERVSDLGAHSALLTCKSKTAKILGTRATIAVAAEAPDQKICDEYGTPPPMYSADINYWLFDLALDMVGKMPDLGLIYVHTTDYPMHMWAPEAPEAKTYMRTLDNYLKKFHDAAPEYTIVLTADHGMNAKTQCWDLSKACKNRGMPLAFSVSPVADRLLKHHGGFGGVSYVYLNAEKDLEQASGLLLSLDGVDSVLDRQTAAQQFSLMPSRIGDLVVLPDRDTVFGDLAQERIQLPDNYRSHGSLYEMDIPLLMFNHKSPMPAYQHINYNLDLTRHLFVAPCGPKE